MGAAGDGALQDVRLLTVPPSLPISAPRPKSSTPTSSSPPLPIALTVANVVVRADVRAKPGETARSGTPVRPNRIDGEVGPEAVDAVAKHVARTSSAAPTASAASRVAGSRVDVPAETEASIDSGTPTRRAHMSSASSELISPFARLLIARGSTMRSTMATLMGKPCPGPHTPGASAHKMAGGRKVSRDGMRGEAAAKRVASCTVDECLSAIRVSPPPPSGNVIGTVHSQRVSPLKRIATADQVTFPHAKLDSTRPPRALERTVEAVIVVPRHPSEIVDHDVHPHPHIRSRSEVVPSPPAPAGSHDGNGSSVASPQNLRKHTAVHPSCRAPRGSEKQKDKEVSPSTCIAHENGLISVQARFADPSKPLTVLLLLPPLLLPLLPPPQRRDWRRWPQRSRPPLCRWGPSWF